MRYLNLTILFLLCFKLSAQLTHSHNDYEQKQPFFAAYNLGFNSIEADVYLKNNELYVAHDWDKISPDRTLMTLYINPILQKIQENNGYPYPNKKSLHLLIDLKKDGKEILILLTEKLKPHKKALKYVTITISGDMPKPSEFKDFDNIFSFDGRKEQIYSTNEYKRVTIVSSSMSDFGKYWAGKTPLSEEIAQKISVFVEENHSKGKKVRLWATPNTVLGFETLKNLGVDYIGTDDLELLANFMR
ncbi:alkaline phosphatase [Arcicella aurantiaca]|uniref:Altered inheritance of mitochondria protein 6 n=1 Tax=Arcicella aurantiaca TaxID=591202 RepID=A0A316E3C1_9BACT|nr:alkaline phosphatase [Arcicella aurantiaca]PWK25177.1 alkaline phosphatase [Arcicella aurantiaca]